jgi:hypothetical protein
MTRAATERPRLGRRLRVGLGLVLLAAAVLASPVIARECRIDACLDRGGCWNHADERCLTAPGARCR